MTYQSYVQCTTCQMAPRRRATDNWGILLSSFSVADCGAPAELEHGLVTFSTRNNLTTYKSEIRYSCQQPYYKMYNNITGEPCLLNQPPPTSHTLWVSGLGWGLKQSISWPQFGRIGNEKHLETCLASPWLRPACQELGHMVIHTSTFTASHRERTLRDMGLISSASAKLGVRVRVSTKKILLIS